MKPQTFLTLASLALAPSLMADPIAQAVEIIPVPKIAICREAPNPASQLKLLKDMEANEESVQALLQNKEAKTALDKLKAPIVLGSLEDALKHLTRASMERIAGSVDFDKQQVVIFAWQGSGQDRLSGHVAPGKVAEARLHYSPGRTEDLRTHTSIYAMPKGIKWTVQQQNVRVIKCGVGELQVRPAPKAQLLEMLIK